MPDSNGEHSYGAKLYYANYGTSNPVGATTGFTELAEVISMSGLPMSAGVTRLTHLNSPDKAHEKIPGITDAGQITFRCNSHEDLLGILFGLLPDGTAATPGHGRYQWLVQFPNGSQWYCTAFVQGMPFEVPEDDRVTVEVALEVSGRPVFNTAA
jgi:hypothetical protein